MKRLIMSLFVVLSLMVVPVAHAAGVIDDGCQSVHTVKKDSKDSSHSKQMADTGHHCGCSAVSIRHDVISYELSPQGELPSKAFVAGVSLPIPVFNANRGNIEKARNDIARVEQENKDKTLLLSASLTQVRQQMDNAYLRAQTLKKEVLPSAQQAFKLAREGYGLGRFAYLEVLDAQRSLFVVKQQHITALKDYHIAKAQLERLTAVHLSKIEEGGPDGQ